MRGFGYGVNSVFYTLQGEGANAGRAAVFLRFMGCNLWTGHEGNRSSGKGECARWCDTEFTEGRRYQDALSVARAVSEAWGSEGGGRRFVVCTGGEPLLQLDGELLYELHGAGFEVAVETNGTRSVPAGINWLTVSPKGGGALVVNAANELKLPFPQAGVTPERLADFQAERFYLQPIDGPSLAENTAKAVAYCLAHPKWRLSTQAQKTWGIP